MPRLKLPKDWKRKATRALNGLNKSGVAGVCFWCGHEYRIGEFSQRTETAHLLRCPQYPQEAKREMRKDKAR